MAQSSDATNPDIARRRLYSQRITGTAFEKPEEVVAWLGAVQAQEYEHAKWGLGLRMQQTTSAAIESDFNEGRILRTHVLRPTWHFVTPADIRWLLALTAPRVHALNAHMYRQLAVEDGLLVPAYDAMAKALEGGNFLTRAELGAALASVGITATGLRLGYFVHRAELDALVCSGPRRGRQFTYALLDERAPDATPFNRDDALAELTRRYFTSHGPALVKDFAGWASLTAADVRLGIEMVKEYLAQEVVDGKTYWFARETPADLPAAPYLLLLPPYDEYGIGYKDHSAILDRAYATLANEMVYGGSIVINGSGVGYWRRALKKDTVLVRLEPFRPLSAAEKDAAEAEAKRFGGFLRLNAVME